MEAILFFISILDKSKNNTHYCVNFYKDYMYMCEIVYTSVSFDSWKASFYYFLIWFIFPHYHHTSITIIYQISIAMGRG